MLKTALCISVLLVAANVCYGHGDELCSYGSKGFITHFTPGEEYIYTLVNYPGGHGHHKSYPDGTESWSYWDIKGYAEVQAQYASGAWDIRGDFDDCKWVVVPTPTPYVPTPSVIPAPMPEPDVTPIVEPEIVAPIPDVMVTYSMTFPKGISALHLPIKPEVFYFTDLFESLGDDNVNWIFALRPTVQHWTHVTSPNSRSDEWISEYRGFVIYMENETTIELTAVEKPYGYRHIYLHDGMNLIGVPRQAEALETVGDFYRRFPGILSVKSIPADIEYDMPTEIDWDWFVDLDDDVAIEPTVGYMIESDGDDVYPLWGTQWVEPVMAAPGITRDIAIMWGKLKSQ